MTPPRPRRWKTVLALAIALALSLPAACENTRFADETNRGIVLSIDTFEGRRGVLFLFSEHDEGSRKLARAISGVVAEGTDANVAFLGLSRDPTREQAKAVAATLGLALPIAHDPDGELSERLRAETDRAYLFVVDGDGRVVARIPAEPETAGDEVETALREFLRLPTEQAAAVRFGMRPTAPPLRVTDLAGDGVDPEEFEGEVALIVFFRHDCPHCHDALVYAEALARDLGDEGLVVVPVSLSPDPDDVRDMREDLGSFLPMYLDADGETRRAYGAGFGVPELVVLDAEHGLIARHVGIEARVQAAVEMTLRAELGVRNPLQLADDGYSGQEICAACHRDEHATWALSRHAYAFDTLVRHGADRDPKCLKCHVVGWNEPGGYDLMTAPEFLEGVQCESCHGRGGPHLAPESEKPDYPALCAQCHTPEHSLRFVAADALPRVSHDADEQLAGLTAAERRRVLKQRDDTARRLFEPAEYVGSASCQECHAAEYAWWEGSRHAAALDTLRATGEHEDAECRKCHVTESDADPAGIGCEGCHGPGGDHVGPDARKRGSILALGDKCEACVILQVCRACHDDANDPGFEYAVEQKIERIRHGAAREQEAGAPK